MTFIQSIKKLTPFYYLNFKTMKMKTYFVAALATMTLAACSKDAETGRRPLPRTNFSVSLPGALETYGVEDPQAAGQIAPYYENVVVYLVDAGNNAMGYS